MATIEFTDKAKKNISNMNAQVSVIQSYYGDNSHEAMKAARSLANVLTNIVRLGGSISGEDDLSLCGQTEYGLVYGVVWLPQKSDSLNVCGERGNN